MKRVEEREREELKLLSLAHVDRFGIILDLWTCEARYLQAKMKVSYKQSQNVLIQHCMNSIRCGSSYLPALID